MIQAAAVSALTSYHWLGIPIAAGGAVLLALGTLFQHRAVEGQPAASGRAAGSMGGGRLQALVRKPMWLGGTAMLGAAILLQLTILIVLAVVLACVAVTYALWRHRSGAVAFTAGAGVLFGFVAALAKTVIGRLFQGNFEWLSLTCLAGLLIAAVAIGITILGEADTAPRWQSYCSSCPGQPPSPESSCWKRSRRSPGPKRTSWTRALDGDGPPPRMRAPGTRAGRSTAAACTTAAIAWIPETATLEASGKERTCPR